MSQNQQTIIDEIIHNPHIPARELAEIVGISSSKIEVNIRKLKELAQSLRMVRVRDVRDLALRFELIGFATLDIL